MVTLCPEPTHDIIEIDEGSFTAHESDDDCVI